MLHRIVDRHTRGMIVVVTLHDHTRYLALRLLVQDVAVEVEATLVVQADRGIRELRLKLRRGIHLVLLRVIVDLDLLFVRITRYVIETTLT